MGRAATAPSWGARFRYFFDTTMTRGTPALIGWLVIATSALVLAFAVTTAVLGLRGSDEGFGYELFQALMHALDPGTVAGDTGSWSFLLTMLVLTLGGLLIVSALIGVISAGIDARLAELRRGRSRVLESDHTVVLGWSDSIYTIVRELTIANESRRRPAVVVLADRDPVEMEEDLRTKVPDLRGSRLVCRSGSPMDIDQLAVTNHGAARSIIVLAPQSEDPDAEVIKTLLALAHSDQRSPHVVAEIRDDANLGAARLVAGENAALLHVDDTIARLLVQTARQSGAGAVYADLFDFDGDEIYVMAQHALGGATYADAQAALEEVTVIGLSDGDGVRLNPSPGTLVGSAALVVVAEDDDALSTPAPAAATADTSLYRAAPPRAAEPSTALVLGWNHRTPVVLRELDAFAAPGSRLTLVTSFGAPVPPPLRHIEVTLVEASTTDRRVLEEHVVAGLDHLLVLAYSDELDVQSADARTLVTLLHVRDLMAGLGSATPVVTEMLDDRNRALAQVTDIDDVVVSGEIVSLLVAQLSEDPRLEAVFAELLGAEGSEVHLRPAGDYVEPGRELAWATVVGAAAARGETAIGLKAAALAEPGHDFGVRINLPKSSRHVLSATGWSCSPRVEGPVEGYPGAVSPACPRCSAPVAPGAGAADTWSCPDHGPTAALWRPPVSSYAGFTDHLARTRDFPTYLPWPLSPGWSVTDVAAVAGGGRTLGTMTCCSGTSELDGPVDVMVVAEESGTGLGARCAGSTHDDPGPGHSDGAPLVRVRLDGKQVPLWAVSTSASSGEWDRSVVAGEALGRWLWLIVRPASAILLLRDDWILRDVSGLGPPLVELPFAGPAPPW